MFPLPQGLLPAQVLAPFAAELAAREKRRRAREREGRRAAARERAAAKAADDARRGPTAAELKAMPTLAAASRAVGGAGAGNAAAAAALAAGPGRSVADAEAEAAARALGFLSAGEYEVSMALQVRQGERNGGGGGGDMVLVIAAVVGPSCCFMFFSPAPSPLSREPHHAARVRWCFNLHPNPDAPCPAPFVPGLP